MLYGIYCIPVAVEITYPGALMALDFVNGKYFVNEIEVAASEIIDRPEDIENGGLLLDWNTADLPVNVIGDAYSIISDVSWTMIFETKESDSGTMRTLFLEDTASGGSDAIWVDSGDSAIYVYDQPNPGTFREAGQLGPPARPAIRKLAVTRTTARLATSINGSPVVTDRISSLKPSISSATIGGSVFDSFLQMLGHVRKLIIYPPQGDPELVTMSVVGSIYIPGAHALDYDAFTVVTGQTGASWNHSHVPINDPKGILFFITGTVGTDTITGVTYGGVPMAEITPDSPLLKATGEPGSVYAYFLGSGIPTGPQTVAVTGTASGTKNSYCFSIDAEGDTAVQDAVTLSSDSVLNPSATLALGGVDCFCALAFTSGVDNTGSIIEKTNWCRHSLTDHGTQVAGSLGYNITDSVDVDAGFDQGANDAVFIAVAIKEI